MYELQKRASVKVLITLDMSLIENLIASKIESKIIKVESIRADAILGYKDFYSQTLTRNQRWNNLKAPTGALFTWDEESTYIHHPPFFQGIKQEPSEI